MVAETLAGAGGEDDERVLTLLKDDLDRLELALAELLVSKLLAKSLWHAAALEWCSFLVLRSLVTAYGGLGMS